MLVDFVGQLNRKYLATAFSSLNGSPTSYNRESAKLIVLSTWEKHSLGLRIQILQNPHYLVAIYK